MCVWYIISNQTDNSKSSYTDNIQSEAEREQRDLTYVKSGVILDLEKGMVFNSENKQVFRGPEGYVFYQGNTPATQIPVSAKVEYQGTWDFTTNVKKDREFKLSSNGSSDRYAGNSFLDSVNRTNDGKKDYAVGHTSKFDVDFNAKTLTGTLTRNGYVNPNDDKSEQEVNDLYKIEAKLHGNRFRGTATAGEKAKNDDYLKKFFGSDSKSVEGGFYGAQAEELGGKFLADDKSLFAVFSAEREATDTLKLDQAFDAKQITVNTEKQTLALKDMDTFGNATQLVVNGRTFSLLPKNTATDYITNHKYDLADKNKLNILACCTNLIFLKFGTYSSDTPADTLNYFLTGERTASSVVATKSGAVTYKGSWAGSIFSDGRSFSTQPEQTAQKSPKAELNFNFDTKQFTGGLYAPDAVAATLNLSGNISGNGFTGIAKTQTGGFNLDPKSTGNAPIAHINDAVVNGGFYGPDAQEVGGTVFSDGKNGGSSIGAVFGAKRQVVVDK